MDTAYSDICLQNTQAIKKSWKQIPVSTKGDSTFPPTSMFSTVSELLEAFAIPPKNPTEITTSIFPTTYSVADVLLANSNIQEAKNNIRSKPMLTSISSTSGEQNIEKTPSQPPVRYRKRTHRHDDALDRIKEKRAYRASIKKQQEEWEKNEKETQD